MAIAFIPVGEDPKGRRDNWLSMNKADELICEMFNEPVHPKHYCRGWFDSFVYFDWYRVSHTHKIDEHAYSFVFETADEALLHYFRCSLYPPSKDETFWESVEGSMDYVKRAIEPIIRLIYSKGYQIVSLNVA